MKTIDEINAIMETIPTEWRDKWCGGENGACACLGCVQIGNRIAMHKEATGLNIIADPEHIDELLIPEDIHQKYKINRDEWDLWMKSQS